ncbi:MAG: hypothetical protein H0U49_10205 [Parachlamydiaceae bacterium]|nr:hypothetical protein [Parachlamydiaceae bacterium]
MLKLGKYMAGCSTVGSGYHFYQESNRLQEEKKAIQIRKQADFEVLYLDVVAYTALAEGLLTRGAILKLPNRLSEGVAHAKSIQDFRTYEEWQNHLKKE